MFIFDILQSAQIKANKMFTLNLSLTFPYKMEETQGLTSRIQASLKAKVIEALTKISKENDTLIYRSRNSMKSLIKGRSQKCATRYI